MEIEARERWNREAAEYQRTYIRGENEYNGLLMDFLANNCGLAPGSRVLDIGCGVGKYGVYFARMGCDVVLTDISPEMLRFAEKNLADTGGKWHTLCGDWREISPDDPALCPKFDVAISTMSPAVSDDETVAKMSAVTDGWCLVTQFCRWEDPLRGEFCRRLGLPEKPVIGNIEDLGGGIIRSVSACGYTPLTAYQDYGWADYRTPEESAARFLARYFDSEPDESTKTAALAAAQEMTDDLGRVRDAVDTRVVWVYWTPKNGGK